MKIRAGERDKRKCENNKKCGKTMAASRKRVEIVNS